MSITINTPIIQTEVSFAISHEDAQLILSIRDKLGKIEAIRVLRMYNNKCGLKQAKEFVENLS